MKKLAAFALLITFCSITVADTPALQISLKDKMKQIKAKMTERGINTSVSPQTSTLLDTRKRDLPPVLRASVHYYNTEEEVDAFIAALAEITGA